MTVLVLGATGTIGRHLAQFLADRGVSTRLATRTPHLLRDAPRGAEAVGFNFDRPETHEPALAGVERAFLLLRTGEPRRLEVGRSLLGSMKAAGVRHVVLLTGYGVDAHETSPMRRLELSLETSGMAHTHLRPSYFMQNFCVGALREGIVKRDEIAVAAGDAAISFIDARDIAAVAAEALSSNAHENRAYDLTGGAAVTHADIARTIGVAAGRAIGYRARTDAEARIELAAAGLPSQAIDTRLMFLAQARTGAFARTTSVVAEVTGRPPRTFDAFAQDHAHLFQAEIAR